MRCHETSRVDGALLDRSQRSLIRAAADLAGFCEHVEHNEPNSIDDAVHAGERLRKIAAELSARSRISLAATYAARIRAVEEKSLLRHLSVRGGAMDLRGADALDSATTWEELQIGQIIHDQQFHPDVFGLPKVDQIRHYTLHVTKLAGLFLESIENDGWTAFRSERLADIAIFGVKIATVCNIELLADAVDTWLTVPPVQTFVNTSVEASAALSQTKTHKS